jgi:hypothetical protein
MKITRPFMLEFWRLPAAATAATTTVAATAATTTATPITTAAPTATAAGTTFTRTRLIDANRTSLELGFVELFDGFGGLVGIGHFYEAETAGLAGKFIDNNDRTVDFPRLGEKRFQVLIGHRVGEVAYVQFCGHQFAPLLSLCRKARSQRNPSRV